MYSKFFVAALLASSAALASASPDPLPTPAVEHQQLQERQNIGDIFNSLTSVAADKITGGGGAVATSVISQVTSAAGSVASEITGGQILTDITSIGGQAVSVITSVGGQALTLATNGVVTSAFGSIYTVATAALSSNNAALGMHSTGLSSPATVGLLTVMGGAMLGAAIIF